MGRIRQAVYRPSAPSEQPGRLFGFVLTAIVVGILTGLMAGSFRLALDWLTWVRRQLLVQAQGNPIPGLLRAVVVCGAAAAGLATAFSAPIAGGVFVLEELTKRFHPRTAVATLLASAAGFMSADLLLGGSSQIFDVAPMHAPRISQAPIILLVGLLTGLVGVVYNKAILSSLRMVDSSRLPREVRAGLIGAVIGLVGFLS